VNTAYGIGSNHGYSFPLPSYLKDGKDHNIYIYGINLAGTGGVSALLPGSPKTINCKSVSTAFTLEVTDVQATTAIEPDSEQLSWSPVPEAIGYAVYRDNLLVRTTLAPSFRDDPVLMPDTTYSYDVLAVKSDSDIVHLALPSASNFPVTIKTCLLYTSDAADDLLC
ncbi:TPA: hypothetical protein DCQ44_02680, partial [Candidatus Taylorbacteria bacterium]|nr:hypothetical protein [Candidatus Taylorbacteria bacterium]